MFENENEYTFTTASEKTEETVQAAQTETPYQQPQSAQYAPPPVYNKPPKKKKPFLSIAAIILAVAVVGTASGFGGSYLANWIIGGVFNSAQAPENNGENVAEEQPPVTTEYQRPVVEVDDSLSTLEHTAEMGNVELTYEQLYDKVSDSIVKINNYTQTTQYGSDDIFYGTAETKYTRAGSGSGIIITADGYIVTNAHVVNGAAKVTVVIHNGTAKEKEIEAVLVGTDSETDLAVLKIGVDETLVPAPLGDSDTLKVGQEVCALGNPSELSNTLTNGIISGLNRFYSSKSGFELSSIQTNTAVNPGNSGGGLFDMYGNVVGVVNSKLVYEGVENIGFAITINEAKPVISDLINYGYVTGRPMLGISSTDINEYTALLYGLPASGILVTSIDETAPVAKCGLKIGDVIIGLNGSRVTTAADFQTVIKNMKSGDTVTITVARAKTNGYGSTTASAEKLEFTTTLTESKAS